MALVAFLKLCGFTQKHRGKVIAISSLGLFAANVSYHVIPEQTFRKVYQAWPKGSPAKLSEKLHTLFQEVLADIRCRSPAGYTPFSAYGFSPVSAGLPWLPEGCLIGIPANFNTEGMDGAGIVDRKLVISGEEVDWTSQVGKKLRESLMLSLDAQKFSLAREAVYAQTNGPVIEASVAPLCFTGVCLSSVGLKQLLGLYTGPMLLRLIFNLFAVSIGFTGYLLCSDEVRLWLDYRSDRKVAALSRSYAQGGLEFYEKTLERNKILRGLMGKQGEKMYAPSGNLFPKHGLRVKHAPYTCRRDRIRQALDIHDRGHMFCCVI
ncbi:transmembrane protein 177 [Hyperolius riggenbachi]|uniref:transmembrane protein 177 n=1 Tax=Hyperolius riggenbachi TaxID=752182 RepID=UPI0035A26692